METWASGSWLKALLHLSIALTSELLKFPVQTSILHPAFTSILLWAESLQVFPLPFSPSLTLFLQPTSCYFFRVCEQLLPSAPALCAPGARDLSSPSAVTDPSVKGSAIHPPSPKETV